MIINYSSFIQLQKTQAEAAEDRHTLFDSLKLVKTTATTKFQKTLMQHL